MAKLNKYKAKPTPSDIDAIRVASKLNFEYNKKVRSEKFEKDKEYINNKLAEMVDMTLSSVDKETTPQQLVDMLKTGDKEWKKFCAIQRVRKISVPIDLYMSTMVANLEHRKILTQDPEQKQLGEAQSFELTNPLENQNEQSENISQDVVEDVKVKTDGELRVEQLKNQRTPDGE